MVKQWKKFINYQNLKTKVVIYEAIKKIRKGERKNLDIKKMEGKHGNFRCRIGNIRIIFQQEKNEIQIKKIGYRWDIYKE